MLLEAHTAGVPSSSWIITKGLILLDAGSSDLFVLSCCQCRTAEQVFFLVSSDAAVANLAAMRLPVEHRRAEAPLALMASWLSSNWQVEGVVRQWRHTVSSVRIVNHMFEGFQDSGC